MIGYFYIIASLISLQLIGDLGLSQLTMNTIAKLLIDKKNQNQELSLSQARNAALKILTVALVFAGLFFLSALIYLFWLHYSGKISHFEVLVMMIFFLAIDLIFLNLVSIIAGSIGADYYYKYKFVRLSIEYLITICVIHAGYLEFAQATGIAVSVVLMAFVLKKSVIYKFLYPECHIEQTAFNIRPDFITMLFKYSVTWLSGFFTFSMIIPLLSFGVTTEKIASLGTLLAIFNGVNMFFYTVAHQKTVTITHLGAKQEFHKIQRFIKTILWFITLGYASILCLIFVFNKIGFNLGVARLTDDLELFFGVSLMFFIHALAIPFFVVGNSLLKNNYAYRNLAWSVVNLFIFGGCFYVAGLPLTLSIVIYSLCQLILFFNVKNNVDFINNVD